VLDVGCYSAQLLVVDPTRDSLLRPVLSHKVRLRLDHALDEDGRITKAGVQQLVAALTEARRVAERAKVHDLVPFATSVIRDAPNAHQVIDQVAERTGVTLGFVSGTDEARLSYLAARRWFGWSAGGLVVLDVGGGTVEIAAGEGETPTIARSLPLGARTLTRTWLDGGMKFDRRLRELRAHAEQEVGAVLDAETTRHLRAVGCSKVFQQLARLAGARPQREGPLVPRRLTLADLRVWIPQLARSSDRRRARFPGISQHRAHQSLAGAVVAEALLTAGGHDVVEICPWSAREGLLLTMVEHRGAGAALVEVA
jgi:exopolyphosphatase/guanosine-5'-triphosphate,3'-diphosphate pyrophosphatase